MCSRAHQSNHCDFGHGAVYMTLYIGSAPTLRTVQSSYRLGRPAMRPPACGRPPGVELHRWNSMLRRPSRSRSNRCTGNGCHARTRLLPSIRRCFVQRACQISVHVACGWPQVSTLRVERCYIAQVTASLQTGCPVPLRWVATTSFRSAQGSSAIIPYLSDRSVLYERCSMPEM